MEDVMRKKLYVIICMLIAIFICCSCNSFADVIILGDDVENMAEDDYKGACEEVSYKDFRNEATYIEEHKKIKCTGEVAQIITEENADSNYYSEYRINITKEDYGYGMFLYIDDIYVYYMLEKNPKLLEGDIVTLYGEVTESVTYNTINNINRTIPAMVAVYVDIEE